MTDLKNLLWTEKYRPTSLEDFVLDEAIKEKLYKWVNQGSFPHLILHGQYGTGKTSIVKFLLDNIDCEALEINASKDKGIDVMREEVSSFLNVTSYQPLKIVVFHEGEQLTPRAQETLKEDIELNSDDTRIIFTTNHIERINGALTSRCEQLHIIPPSTMAVAEWIKKILDRENISIPEDQKQPLWNLIKDNFPDIRSTVKRLQSSIIDGKLDVKEGKDFKEFSKILEIIKEAGSTNKVDKFYEIRKIVGSISPNSLKNIYEYLYNNLDTIYNDDIYYFAVPIIAKYQYQSSFDVDIELNVSALIQELLEIKNG